MNTTFDEQREIEKITSFLRTTLHSRGFSSFVLGCSGGLDSTTSLYLAEKALGKDAIIPLLLPYNNLHSTHVRDAKKALIQLGIQHNQIRIFDITHSVDIIAQSVGIKTPPTTSEERLRLGNIMARIRMILIYDTAKAHNALVLGTENKSEHLLGYYTRFGDEASDVEPLRHLYKTEVYKIAKKLSIPDPILKKAPTAALWPNQTDEDELGFTYADADQILYRSLDAHKKREEIIAEGYDKDLVTKVLNRLDSVKFKYHLPIIFKSEL